MSRYKIQQGSKVLLKLFIYMFLPYSQENYVFKGNLFMHKIFHKLFINFVIRFYLLLGI